MRSATRERLVGWKAIGAFVGRDARTAKRWEAERAMPVRRTPGLRPTVWADAGQLSAWMDAARRTEARPRAAPETEPYSDDPDLRDLYIQTRAAADSRTLAGLEHATAACDVLIRRAPDVAAGHLALAECQLLSREFGSIADQTAFDGALRSTERARRAAGLTADVSRLLGFIQFWRDGEKSGLDLLRRAAELAPHSPRARHWLASALCANGDLPAAMTEYAAAQRLSPGATEILADFALANAAGGAWRTARGQLELLLKIAPWFSAAPAYLSQLDLLEQRDADFIDHNLAASRLRGERDAAQVAGELRAALTDGGPVAMRSTYAAQRERALAGGREGALTVARAWAASGRLDRAMKWVGQARESFGRAVQDDYFLEHYLRPQLPLVVRSSPE